MISLSQQINAHLQQLSLVLLVTLSRMLLTIQPSAMLHTSTGPSAVV
jgi:hypothetical protein